MTVHGQGAESGLECQEPWPQSCSKVEGNNWSPPRPAPPRPSRYRSRLGCQIKCSKELEGMKLRIPSATRNMAVDGFVPKPH